MPKPTKGPAKEKKQAEAPKEEKPVKSEKAHAKAEENDAKAGMQQPKLVQPTIEQRWNEIGSLRGQEVGLEDKLAKVNLEKKAIEAELAKIAEKLKALENIAAGIPVQQKLDTDSKKKDDRQFMDESSYKSAEELRRHPQEAIG